MALYRSGDWAGAAHALVKADELLSGMDREHRFFLAMTYWRLGEEEKARQCYDEAIAWLEAAQRNKSQYRFRAEAEELMGLNQRETESNS